jgi:hypothetical protein
MATEPREVHSRDGTEGAESPEKHDEALKTKFRRFMTSLPGVLTGVATVITATATIIGVLTHNSNLTLSKASTSSPPPPTGSISGSGANANAPSPPPASASNPSGPGAKLVWSGSLLFAGDGTALPDNTSGGTAIAYPQGNAFAPLWGTEIAVWDGNSMPTPQQCASWAATQSPGASVSVPVTKGSWVCALVDNPPFGPLAIIHVTGIDQGSDELDIETQTSVYTLSGS